jgi:hypothetical protein
MEIVCSFWQGRESPWPLAQKEFACQAGQAGSVPAARSNFHALPPGRGTQARIGKSIGREDRVFRAPTGRNNPALGFSSEGKTCPEGAPEIRNPLARLVPPIQGGNPPRTEPRTAFRLRGTCPGLCCVGPVGADSGRDSARFGTLLPDEPSLPPTYGFGAELNQSRKHNKPLLPWGIGGADRTTALGYLQTKCFNLHKYYKKFSK